ncbi:MAG TPA: glycosyltransferase family 9 protein [Ignavibacteria bacterium]|nr:glycosyltransferase family 9 protein [Ignavibacteria bacterium]
MLTLPMVDALKNIYPEAKIDFLVQQRVYELIYDYPGLNKVHAIDEVTAGKVKAICREKRYDLAIAVYPTFEVALGLFLGRVKYRIGTGYRWYSFLFNLPHYQHRKEALKHESTYNLDLLSELNIVYDKELEVKLQVKNEHVESAIGKLKVFGFNENERFIVIHIPSLGSAKVWSNSNFKQLLEIILANVNNCYQVVLTGTEEDEEQVKRITAQLPANSRIFEVFSLNLKELTALLSKSKLFLGNSTGPIHIAAAVGTFVVGLYSPVKVESPLRWGPLTEEKKIFVPDEDDNSRDVMNDIEPNEVYNFINNYMELNK